MQLKTLFKILGLLIFTIILGFTTYVYLYYDQYVSSPQKLLNYKDQGIVLTDRNDTPFYYINNAKRKEYVPLSQISPYVGEAIITSEDRNFYHHMGVSFQGILRSFLLNLQSGTFAYGGSTITQQLVKNTLLSPKKSITRKLEEAILAFDLDARYSKDKILEMYMNTIYYGDGAIGIDEAAHTYFNKKPKDLTLPEAAYIAGMLKYPSLLSPFTGDKKRGIRIQETVLTNMQKDGLISAKQEELAINSSITFEKGNSNENNDAPHFALLVEDKLKEMYGNDVIYEGLKVKTSLDLDWQRFAQNVVESGVDSNAANGVGNGAVVVMNPTNGEVLVMVGSKDWFDEQYGRVNMAMAPRQPGSSFKPIVYSLALDEGMITPTSVLEDKPKKFVLDSHCPIHSTSSDCVYSPMDFDRSYRGMVTVRRALANSLNIPAVEVMDRLGIDTLLSRAPDFGITTLKDSTYYGKGLSLVLGSAEVPPLEMATAYSTFANNGTRPDPVTVLEVKDKYGNVIYQYQPHLHQVISAQSAYLISSILSDDNARREEFGNLLSTPFNAAVKTGTTENYRDAWTIGYTPHLVTAVWVGNNSGKPIYNLPGSLAAAPIWKKIMEQFVNRTEFKGFTKPDGIVEATYCDPTASNSAKTDYFAEGTEPPSKCPSSIKRNALGYGGSDTNSQFENKTIQSPQDDSVSPAPTAAIQSQ